MIAPTYTLLSDATMRSFVSVGEGLGMVSEVRRSAPPEVKLSNGAEVLFRSADDPDRLRGPNVSGVWLDEASLMEEEVFTVAIGRLREAGEIGFLTATFTPKGKAHWTYRVFATGGPDVELFRARTSDNPFLHEKFESTTRRQYTSKLAAQELEGEFMDQAGGLFSRAWFPIIDAPDQRIVSRVRAWDLAATVKDEKKADDPDWTVGTLMGKGEGGTFYIQHVRRFRDTPLKVEKAVKDQAEADGKLVHIWMEQEPGSSGVGLIDHYVRKLAGYTFRGERSTGSKEDRAQPFAAAAEGGLVKLVRGGWNKDWLDEIETVPFGKHDDQCDSASLAFNKLTAKRQFWMR